MNTKGILGKHYFNALSIKSYPFPVKKTNIFSDFKHDGI